MLPKLAEIFGVSVDVLLGVETAPLHQGEVVSECDVEEDNDKKFSFQWDSGRRGAIGFACWVLLMGVLLLLGNLFELDIGIWSLAWPSFILMGGIFWGDGHFSFFRLGCILFGGYFLLNNLQIIPVSLGSELLWPVLVLLLGLSLLVDALRKPKKSTVTFKRDGKSHNKSVNQLSLSENGFECENNFGENTHRIDLSTLRRGHAENNFGTMRLDFSGISAVAEDCKVELECNFGELLVSVPRKYCVKLNPESAFGSVTISGEPDATPQGTIAMTCSANFGNIQIIYI